MKIGIRLAFKELGKNKPEVHRGVQRFHIDLKRGTMLFVTEAGATRKLSVKQVQWHHAALDRELE